MADDDGKGVTIVIKKVKKVSGGGHHGGAWKVAYADFVTAMMAFFMLLWLLNVAPKDTLDGLADYFSPTVASTSTDTGSGSVLGGTAPSAEGAQSSGATIVKVATPPPTVEVKERREILEKDSSKDSQNAFSSTISTFSDAQLNAAADRLRQSIQSTPALAKHEDQMITEQTPDGLRIQIMDRERRPMFRDGTAELYDYAVKLVQEIGKVVEELPNRISIHGHTDGKVFERADGYSNWELSSDRANAARRVISAMGVSQDRFSEVVGKAMTEPLFPDQVMRPENRRITILVLREAPVLDPGYGRQ